ncbi:MAG: hypothetical protein ACHRXM_37450 [Isosphaerales bacterium]
MRRPPEVGLVLLSLSVLLPGFSGCAGLPQRLSLSSPSKTGSDGAETPASSRFSWWRGSGSEAGSSSDHASNVAEDGKAAAAAGGGKLPGDVWPESRSEWLARRFPLLSRGWNGNAGERVRDGVDPSVHAQGSRVSARSGAPRDSQTARADDDVRPVQASSGDDSASGGGNSDRGRSERNERSRMPTLLAAAGHRHSLPESSGDVELDVSSSGPRGDDRLSPGETHPAPADTRQPAEDSPVASPSERAASEPRSAADEPGSASRAVPSPAEAGPGRLMAMAAGNGSALTPAFSTDSDTMVGFASGPNPSSELESAPAQVPPAPKPPAQRTPPPPPLPDGARPVAEPTEPQAPASSEEKEAKPQPSQAPAPSSAVAPAPVAPQSQAPSSASGPSLFRPAAQSSYASPPPVAPPEPRGTFLSWLHPDRHADPLASPQLPPATFPTTYVQNASIAMPVRSTPQQDAVPCVTPANAAKKPCALSGLLHKLKSWGHGSGCGGCQREGSPSCCHGCTCCAGKRSTVSGSPQGPAASLRGPLAPLVALVRSRGTEPGDVAQGGKVFDSAVSQSLYESSQR